ncbi:MAG: V-type ATP synthase subunit D [Lentisphaerae bacterium ADurb.Bin242]|nr:MAG: V-type ATP synthase subunit D [Lentisphaerae bacterium ADurb.Bin242]
MSDKIKFTKTELKLQQEMLRQFLRFLPPLQLKKQQLQMEIHATRERLKQIQNQEEALLDSLAGWVGLFRDEAMVQNLRKEIRLTKIERGEANIAGVLVPTFTGAEFSMPALDPMTTEWYWDDAAEVLRKAVSLRAAAIIIGEQERLLAKELKMTSQRVNLFEKVKIPECRENIHRIRIQLSDQETSAIVRAKIAQSLDKEDGEDEL